MTKKGRVFSNAALAAAAGLGLAACLGKMSSGTDSETHFACVSDDDCTVKVSGGRCVQGYCRKQPLGQSKLEVADSAAPAPPASSSGTAAAAPGPWSMQLSDPVTLSGTITLGDGFTPPDGDLRVALVFRTPQMSSDSGSDVECPNGLTRENQSVVQNAETSATVPGHFTIRLTETPPYEAFSHPSLFAESANVTIGKVVVYLDGNRNGTLDFATLSADSPDTVLGTSSPWDTDMNLGFWPNADTYRVYFSDRYVGSYGPPLEAGYGISHFRTNEIEVNGEGERLPLDADIGVVLGDKLRISTLVCEKICFQPGEHYTCPDHVGALAPGGEGMCFRATREFWASYSWQRPRCTGCRCGGDACQFALDPSLPVPSDWPCSVSDAGP